MACVWAPPKQFDEYTLVRSLGRGAMGQVFVAHDEFLDRDVAIKFVTKADDAHALARFRTEARAIARLQHPNVVAVYRVGTVLGQPYIVSELVRGRTLDTIEKPIDPKRGLAIAIDLAGGLAAAHQQGVLHRDIKPSNAILGDDGRTKLLDFGLAKLTLETIPIAPPVPAEAAELDGLHIDSTIDLHNTLEAVPAASSKSEAQWSRPKQGHDLTNVGEILGTPLYLAPECWDHQPATPASDIYSLGALLYHLFSGRPPHLAETLPRLCRRVIKEPIVDLASTAPVDRAISAVIMRALARDPVMRFGDANELHEALTRVAREQRSAGPVQEQPYRGLLPFDGDQRALFFGRDVEVRDIVERLRYEPFVLVAGDSGVGKSSLCRAGVIPVLLETTQCNVAQLIPGRRPRAAILSAISAAIASGDSVRRDLEEQRETTLPPGESLLLFIDQLENLLTASDPDEARLAAELIGHLARDVPGVRILATARSDFLSELAALTGLRETMTRALFLLPSMTPDAMRAAIVEPARLRGVEVELAAVEQLIAAGSHAGGLPLVQFTLAELWARRDPQSSILSAAALAELGGVGGALARHGDAVLAKLRPHQREVARDLLTRLVGSDRERVRWEASELSAESFEVAEALIRGRLVTATEGDAGATLEIAHDALISGWGTLAEWLDTDAQRRRQRARIEDRAREWLRLGRPRDHLLAPSRLRELRQLGELALSRDGAVLVAASQRAAIARRLLIGGVVAVMIASTSIGIVIARRGEQRRRAQTIARRLEQAGTQLAAIDLAEQRAVALRRDALAKFDRGDPKMGETIWEQARAVSGDVSRQRLDAALWLEATLALDPSDDKTREQLVRVIYARALEAERDGRDDAVHELVSRLEALAPGSPLLRSWRAPARLDATIAPADAAVRIERYERRADGHLVPVAVPTWPTDSSLPAGSYRIVAEAPGRALVALPVLLSRGQTRRVQLALPARASVPDDLVFVPAGEALSGSSADDNMRSLFFNAAPLHSVAGDAFLIARHETTFAQWIEYLESLPPAERLQRMPRPGPWGHISLARLAAQTYELTLAPTTVAIHARTGEPLVYAARDHHREVEWMRLPVSGVSAEDARAYTGWLRSTGRVPGARLCTEMEWERAARGADDRIYPNGYRLAPSDANHFPTYGAGAGPDEVGSFPASRSPYGVDDLTGNVFEFTTHATKPGTYVVRGGGFFFNSVTSQLVNRTELEPGVLGLSVGIRVCADPPR